jgi:hypothetical protein
VKTLPLSQLVAEDPPSPSQLQELLILAKGSSNLICNLVQIILVPISAHQVMHHFSSHYTPQSYLCKEPIRLPSNLDQASVRLRRIHRIPLPPALVILIKTLSFFSKF